ncbi:hypothetical protein [Chromohalobacter nigrandesensis]|uniref:hypothetical protein n=1 Tax=Chromohalobacter nigrandesensis TaxID=119863 RepID=UPI001FF2BB29|nr:hypothetical protein [Chromohalobacter nigrandesensis]MCK0744698.1 hypothetical protein [Chromohalobacter nigrandesensis]
MPASAISLEQQQRLIKIVRPLEATAREVRVSDLNARRLASDLTLKSLAISLKGAIIGLLSSFFSISPIWIRTP